MKLKMTIVLVTIILVFTIYACSNDVSTTTLLETTLTTITNSTTTTASTSLVCNDDEKLIDGTCIKLMDVTYTLEEVTEDFDRVVHIFDYFNPMLFSNQEDVDNVISEQRLLLRDGMTQLELMRVIAPVIAAYKCGHSHIFPGSELYQYLDDYASLVPLLVKIISGKLYVVNNLENEEIPIGSEIISINNYSVDEIYNIFMKGFSTDGDNLTAINNIVNDHFNHFFMELIDITDNYDIEYLKPDTTEILTINIPGVISSTLSEYYNYGEFHPVSTSYCNDYAILKIRTFQELPNYTLSDFSEAFLDFFTYVNDNEIENVIIDVRGNGGGDPRPSSELFSYIAKYSQPYWVDSVPDYYPGLKEDVPLASQHYSGNLYFLVDGGCFSTTGHFVALVKSQEIGVIIGEETGGSYACSDSSSSYTLPNTKLTVYTSKQIWEVFTEGLTHGRGIIPDYELNLTLADYINGTDSVMDFTIDLINSSN